MSASSSQTQQLNVTVDDTSPLIRYTPSLPTNVTTQGWAGVCAAPFPFWRCDEQSAHYTGMDGAKLSLSFYGQGITLYGNVSLGMSFNLTLDDAPQTVNPGGGSDGQTLADLENLSMAQHTVTLITKQGGSQSALWFDKAVVNLGTASSVNKTYYTSGDTVNIIYGPATDHDWASYASYKGTIAPPGVDNSTFMGSETEGATMYHRFTGSAFFYYGPCYEDNGAYTVSLDGNANTQPVALNASVPYGQVIEGCLHYHAAGLSKGTEHEILATNAENRWLTVAWLEVWDYELVNNGNSNNGGAHSASLSQIRSPHQLSFTSVFFVIYLILLWIF